MGAHARIALVFALAVLSAGCGGCGGDTGGLDATVPPVDMPLPAEWLELGTGFDQFVPYGEPAIGELIAGPQGGFHVWTSLRARNPATTMSPLVSIEYERVRDGMIVSYPFRVRVSFDRVPDTDLQEIYGLRPEALSDTDVVDEDIIVRARVETRDGNFIVVEKTIHVVRAVVPPLEDGGVVDGGAVDGGDADGGDADGGIDDGGTADSGVDDAGAADSGV